MIRISRIISVLKLFNRGYGAYRRQIILLAILGFFSGLLEGIGVNAIIPLFSFVSGGRDRGTDFISRTIEDFFNFFHIGYNLKYLLIFISALFILKAIALIIFNYINVKITSHYERKTRSDLFRDTMLAGWPYLLRQKIGYLEQVLITDISRSSALLRHLSGIILLVTNLLMYTAIALNVSVLITLLTLFFGFILFLFFKPMFYKARIIAQHQADITKEAAHFVNENMIGAKAVKAARAETSVLKKAAEYFDKLREASIHANFLSSVNNSLVEPVGILFIVSLFALSYKLPSFSFASFAVIIYLIQRIFSHLQVAQNRLQTISELVPYLGITIKYKQDAATHKETDAGTRDFQFNDKLEFKNVGFSYSREKEILSEVNFSIEKGKMVGLIGPSGAGKTTVVDLILRLFEPSNGKILLDNVPISEISLGQWRGKIGYVSQDIFLLNDTIANNIKFYNEAVSEDDLMAAAKIANIYDFIQEQPDKFDTMVGERGLLLSGGQRQRIVLARTLARKPELLVLDEATSALDSESEVLIQKAIENLKGKITTLVIAHRISTVTNSDRLIVLDKGKITEQGAPEELLEDNASYFYKMYNIRNHEQS